MVAILIFPIGRNVQQPVRGESKAGPGPVLTRPPPTEELIVSGTLRKHGIVTQATAKVRRHITPLYVLSIYSKLVR